MKVLILLISVVSLVSARSLMNPTIKVSIDGVDDCIKQHLKTKGMLGDDVTMGVIEDAESCKNYVDLLGEVMMVGLSAKVDNDKKMKGHATCIKEKMKQSDIADLLLLMDIYIDLDAEKNDENAKTKKKETEKKIIEIMFTAIIDCQGDEQFGKIFDDLENEEDKEEDDQSEYCLREYIKEQKLIDESMDLKVNPKNLDTTNIDCPMLVEKHMKETEKKIAMSVMRDSSDETKSSEESKDNDDKKKCMRKEVSDMELVRKTLKFGFIKELTMTDEQKKEMRKEFVDLMKGLAMKYPKCM